MKDGLVPSRGNIETLSVSLDIGALPLYQVTLTEMSLSTAVLMEISQMTDKFIPAYKLLLDKVTLILGVGTAGNSHNNIIIVNTYFNKIIHF